MIFIPWKLFPCIKLFKTMMFVLQSFWCNLITVGLVQIIPSNGLEKVAGRHQHSLHQSAYSKFWFWTSIICFCFQGQYAEKTGSTSCSQCKPGDYATSLAQSHCDYCPISTYCKYVAFIITYLLIFLVTLFYMQWFKCMFNRFLRTPLHRPMVYQIWIS